MVKEGEFDFSSSIPIGCFLYCVKINVHKIYVCKMWIYFKVYVIIST